MAQLKQLLDTGVLNKDAYRAAVAALKQYKGPKASVKGSGAVAQGEKSTAAGKGGLAIGGNFKGNIYIGPPPKNETAALKLYWEMVVTNWRTLPLRGISMEATDATKGNQPLHLDQVYVNLDTTARVPVSEKSFLRGKAFLRGVPEEPKVLNGLEAISSNRRCVILGDPGSGKSTFLNHLGLCLALNALDSKGKWLKHLPGWPQKTAKLFPITVILRDFALSLPKQETQAHARHIWEFICGQLHDQNLNGAAKPLETALNEGQAIVMLDGLDEVPTQQQRIFIRDAVEKFSTRYPKSRLVVTCRILSYQDTALQLPGIPAYELAAFDTEKIDRFIVAWYQELERVGTVKSADVPGLSRELKGAVRRQDLWRLASNPLLLTVMAGLHAHKGRLPDARALLYEETIDILLSRWEEVKVQGKEGPQLRQLLAEANRTEADLKRVLRQLAFDAHQQAGSSAEDELADISEQKLIKAIAELHPKKSHDWAIEIIKVIKERAGLLLERAPDVYTFPHRTFQEYLAGAHIANQTNFAKTALRLVEEGTYWEQVVLLAVGRLIHHIEDFERPLSLVAELCPQKVKGADDRAWHKIWFAAKVLNEIGVNRVQDSQHGQELWERVQEHMVALLRQSKLTTVERAKAGNTLAELGDPRFRADAWYLPNEPLLGFVEIPGGPFRMGSQEGYDNEKPPHEVTLPQYYMARYPVTGHIILWERVQEHMVALLRQSKLTTVERAKAGNTLAELGDPRFRADAWYLPNEPLLGFVEIPGGPFRMGSQEGYDNEKPPHEVTLPQYYMARYPVTVAEFKAFVDHKDFTLQDPERTPNHPVVNITWNEALAYCEWLTEQLRNSEETPEPLATLLKIGEGQGPPWVITLPSEAEWEKAALGMDDRKYPWGQEPDPNKANYGDTGIHTTSAVGCFAGGESPYGVEDMSGNVLEWTRSLFKEYPYPSEEHERLERERLNSQDRRVLRGGSFFDTDVGVRCAYRDFIPPDGAHWSIGFRVVASPFSSPGPLSSLDSETLKIRTSFCFGTFAT